MFFEKISEGGYLYSQFLTTYGCKCICNHPNQPFGKSTDGADKGMNDKTNNNTCSHISG